MSTPKQENYNLHNQEELVVLDKGDKPLSPEQINDLEGPIDNEKPLEQTDWQEVKKKLEEQSFEVMGEREFCSSGSFGPLYKIRVRSRQSGEEKYILERTFIEIKDIEKRFSLVEENNSKDISDSEPRYEIVNHLDEKKDKLVIDYLYNEEKALKALQGIKGIPKFYGAVYDDLMGSTLEEFIDGYDLSVVLIQEKNMDQEVLSDILKKVEAAYTQAAQMGYVHGDPTGSTIMVDSANQPYLADWYLYSHGAIDADPGVKDAYLAGLEKIIEVQQRAKLLNN